MRWLLNLGYLISATAVVGIGAVMGFLLSAVMSVLGFIAMMGGAIAVVAVVIREVCESKKPD
jgi:hypothetical protein